MADIRCQMCGKPNPADAEVCQFCQARLKPVWASKSAESFFDAESESEEEVPDWLSSLRGPDEPASVQPPEEKPEEGSFGGIESRETTGAEDWLSGLGAKDEIAPDVVGGVFDLQSGDDLSELLSDSTKPEVEQPDWMGETAGVAAGEPGQFPEETPAEAALGEEGDQSDWLDRVKARQKEDEGQQKGFSFEQERAPLGEEEVPDWLTRMTLGETEIPEDSQSLPDWMKDATPAAQDEFSAFFSSEPGAAQTVGPEADSDWLSGGMGQPQETASASGDEFGSLFAPEPEAAEPGALDSGLDWMTGVYGEASAESSEEASAEAKGSLASQNDFPDWLSALGVSARQEPPQAGLDLGQSFPQEPVAGVELPAAGQTPDWLAGLGGESLASLEGTQEQPPASSSAFDDTFDTSTPGQEQTMPDWLAKVDTQGVPTSTGGPSPFLPDEPEEAAPVTEYLTTAPDWLSQVGAEPAEAEEELPRPEPEQEPGLERAELPNWLEAMRPIEAGSSEPYKDVTDGRLESAGPLAGLRGALPAGQYAKRQRRPTTSALKIQVPEEQQNRATVLQKLLEDESVARPMPAPALAAIPILLRLVVFGVFALASFFALWLGGKQVPLPSRNLIPQAAQDFHARVDQLPAGVPVLFAVDFEPAFSGELDGAATAVLGHLARKDSLVTFVSTTYNGPALAQRLLQAVNRQSDFLQNPFTNFRNMGYIPGGAAGLSALARTPAVVLPYDLNDNFVWGIAPFDSARGLNNFAMVVVITHDADTARAWIEQVGPALGEIPLQMVVSAQAEPLVQPYYAGLPRQVTGLVTGLAGGVAYEILEGRSGVAAQSWDAYSISLTLAVIMILVGGVFGVGSVTLSQYKQTKAEGKA